MSLLKKASIITTPTAYAEDYLYSIKPAIPFGEELVVNGNFHNNVDSWSNGNSGVNTWVNGHLVCTGDGGSYAAARQIIPAVENRKYIVTAQIARVSGSFQVGIEVNDGNGSGWNVIGSKTTSSEFVTVSEVITTNTGTTQLDLRATIFNATVDNTNSLKLDNVSVKLLTDADFDFDRNSTGTRVNEDYLIEDVPYNLATYSEDLSNASWTKTNATVTTNQILAPDGTLTADKVSISSDALSGVRVFTQIDKQKYNFSSFIKKGTTSSVKFYIIQQGVAEYKFDVNLDTGTLGTIPSGITNAKIESAGNDWFRVSCVRDFTAGASNHGIGVVTENGNGGNYYVWGAQLVKGDQPKDYLKTTDRLDIPRIDYTNGEPSILLELSRTNLVTYSQDFSSSNWFNQQSSEADNVAISPEGLQNASKLIEDSSNNRHIIYDSMSSSAGTVYTFSVFLKKAGRNYAVLRLDDDSPIINTWFDLESGTVGTMNSESASIEDYGNGWYRCSVQYTADSSIMYAVIATATSDNVLYYQGDGTSGIFMYGAQVEAGSYATSLIHTSGSAVTRSADYANNAGNSDLISSTEGVLYAEIKANSNDEAGRQITINDSTVNNTVQIKYTGTDNRIDGVVKSGGVQQATFNHTLSTVLEYHKIAVKYKANDCAFYVDGQEIATDTSATMPVGLKELAFDNGNLGSRFLGNCKMVAVFKEALTDLELEKLTGYNNHELYMNYYNRLSYLGLVEEYNVESDINNYIL